MWGIKRERETLPATSPESEKNVISQRAEWWWGVYIYKIPQACRDLKIVPISVCQVHFCNNNIIPKGLFPGGIRILLCSVFFKTFEETEQEQDQRRSNDPKNTIYTTHVSTTSQHTVASGHFMP